MLLVNLVSTLLSVTTLQAASLSLSPVANVALPSNVSQNSHVNEISPKNSLQFERNQGQAAPTVQYLARGRGYKAALTATKLTLDLISPSKNSLPVPNPLQKFAPTNHQILPVSFKLVGANDVPAQELGPLPGKVGYTLAKNSQTENIEVATFGSLVYKQVYPKIDLKYHSTTQRDLEYTFVVAPGGDPNLILLEFAGINRLEIAPTGEALLSVGTEQLKHLPPLIYQEVNGQRQVVSGSFIKKSEARLGFQIGSYDSTLPLVIDPVIVFSTYIGTAGLDAGWGITTDGAGNVYVTGETSGDVFVNKFRPTGELVYSRIVAGAGNEVSYSIAVDRQNQAFIAGHSTSEAGLFASCAGGAAEDAFVMKLLPDGLPDAIFCMLGNGQDFLYGVATDPSGNVYAAASTSSLNLVNILGLPAGGLPQIGGVNDGTNGDAFLLKFTNNLVATYFTYLGGNGPDGAYALAVSANGTVYVTGVTSSSNFHRAATPYKGSGDAFLAILPAIPNTDLIHSRYIGGSGPDYANSIALDPDSSKIYLAGKTFSSDLETFNGYQGAAPGGGDAFVASYSSNSLFHNEYLSYLGGSADDEATKVVIDAKGVAYVTGYTASLSDFPTRLGAECPTNLSGTGTDIFVTRLNPALFGDASLLSSFLLGGDGSDIAQSMTLDSKGKYYLTGATSSSNFPISPGATDTTFNGNLDTFVTGFYPETSQPDVPNLSKFDEDDLYTRASAATALGNGISFNFDVRRYYGLVNANGRLIDTDLSYPPADRARNANVHAPTAYVQLWAKATGGSLPAQNLNVTIANKTGTISTTFSVMLPAIPSASSAISIPIPVANLFFPDICNGETVSRSPQINNCLRDYNKKNYSATSDPNLDDEAKFPTLRPVLNKITITGWSSGFQPASVSCGSFLFLNGVRPVLFAGGFEPAPGIVDTTKDWGATKSLAEQPEIPPGTPTNYAVNNWIRWLGNVGIANWNPAQDGSVAPDNILPFLVGGAKFLQRVYGAKKVNVIAVSYGGINSRLLAYRANLSNSIPGFSVDKILTIDSPHTGVSRAGSLARLILGNAADNIGSDQMEKFNRLYNLKSGWSSDDSKNYLFFATLEGKIKECYYGVVTGCLAVNTNHDGVVETISGLGTGYPDPLSNNANLPGPYATYLTDSNIIKACDFVMNDILDGVCHVWSPHSLQLANWLTSTSGILDYTKNRILFSTLIGNITKERQNAKSGQGNQSDSSCVMDDFGGIPAVTWSCTGNWANKLAYQPGIRPVGGSLSQGVSNAGRGSFWCGVVSIAGMVVGEAASTVGRFTSTVSRSPTRNFSSSQSQYYSGERGARVSAGINNCSFHNRGDLLHNQLHPTLATERERQVVAISASPEPEVYNDQQNANASSNNTSSEEMGYARELAMDCTGRTDSNSGIISLLTATDSNGHPEIRANDWYNNTECWHFNHINRDGRVTNQANNSETPSLGYVDSAVVRLAFIAPNSGRSNSSTKPLSGNILSDFSSPVFNKFLPSVEGAALSNSPTIQVSRGNLAANSSLAIPFKIEANATDVVVKVGILNNLLVQARIERADNSVVAGNEATPVNFAFSGTVLAPGSYKLILTAGAITTTANYYAEVVASSNLIFATRVEKPTFGGTQGKLIGYLLNGTVPFSGATISSTLEIYASNGTSTTNTLNFSYDSTNNYYFALLPTSLVSQTVVASVYASGTISGTVFTRFSHNVFRARSGELKFSGPYTWQTLTGGRTGYRKY